MTKAQDQRSQSMKEQAYNVDKDNDKSLTTTAISMNLRRSATINSLWERLMCCSFLRFRYTYPLLCYVSTERILNGTEDIGGSVVPKEVTEEVVQQPELELRKGKRNKTSKNFGPEFQLYLIEGTRNEVSDQHSYCFNIEDDPKTFDEVDVTKKFLSSRFFMKDMEEADDILGIRIKHEMSTPMDISKKLMRNNGQAVSQVEYSRVIGCLMYVMTSTRPDIGFVVCKLSRHTSNPGIQHWQAIQRVLKYLKKIMDYSLTYTSYPWVLEGYTDASCIINTENNSSTSGWVFLLDGDAIS
uniref:Zinc finger, CCHC-type n=1 Tax=Tanacetum cinerariifolium TaxID=118510 RepID=A0A6L2JT38_TANCI|nr:zinc finger, CCHC-type [Tanacetum cinerariifolium]